MKTFLQLSLLLMFAFPATAQQQIENNFTNEPIATKLSETAVKADDAIWKSTQLGNLRNPERPRRRQWTETAFLPVAGHQVALLVQTPNRDNFLQNIHFFVRRDGNPQEKFRAIIYRVDKETGLPGEVALKSDIALSGSVGNEWVSYDVSRFGITVPEEGLFITMGWSPELVEERSYWNGGTKILADGQRLGASRIERGREPYEGKVAIKFETNAPWRLIGTPTAIMVPFIKSDIIERQ